MSGNVRSRLAYRLACAALGLVSACSFDPADRWISRPLPSEPKPAVQLEPCRVGAVRCGSGLERCSDTGAGPTWEVIDDCAARGQVCADELQACANCIPNSQSCSGQTVLRCDALGETSARVDECDVTAAEACRGGSCTNLCTLAAEQRSNVGCEYWAVDLDNAVAGPTLNAAAQQFAVVVSNPQPDLSALVRIELDDSAPGEPNAPSQLAEATVSPFNLVVFPLPAREVDGSPPGQYNTGTNTALTRHAYRVTSTVPVVAYQFNPLENVDVFSNDASLLKPVEALRGSVGTLEDAYVVLGWPQTIASTDDPNTNFGSGTPLDFRAFLTIVGTRADTRVRVTTAARVLGGGPVMTLQAGATAEFSLAAFDVLNLETDDFGSDFSSSIIAADGPIAVFSGSEASDAPRFDRISERRCCADHLEEQLDPIRSAGKRFIAPLSFNRHLALSNAGARLEPQLEPEVFRLMAVLQGGATVRTSLSGELAEFRLDARGSWREIVSTEDFWIESDSAVMLGNVTASQSAAGIPGNLPGGDPSLIIIPPIEQYRADYVFLTPDRYSFDFLRIMAPRTAHVRLDAASVENLPSCHLERGTSLDQPLPVASGYVVYHCQLSFPVIDPALDADAALQPGEQSDGVHEVRSDQPIGVIVDGFDRNVSYGYAAGTELREIVPR
jgi:IgGFc binding protein